MPGKSKRRKTSRQGNRGATFQEWNWRATFTDCRRQVFYVYEEICDSPSPSYAAHSLFAERDLLSFSTIGVSYIFVLYILPLLV